MSANQSPQPTKPTYYKQIKPNTLGQPKPGLRLVFVWLVLPVLVLGGVLVGWLVSNRPAVRDQQERQTIDLTDQSKAEVKTEPKPPVADQVGLNTLFFGDVFWGRYIDDWSKQSELKTAYPFSGLRSLEREKYQAWIADLECPITTTYLSSAQQDSQLKFSCPAEYTPEAAKWFSAFTLANNHTDNMEEVQGLQQTRDHLEKNGIQHFGHFDNAVKNDLCEVVSFKGVSIFKSKPESDLPARDVFVPLVLCGFHNVFRLPKEDELAVITEYSKYLPTIIMPHQGVEYATKSDPLQRQYFKQMIDLGADAVIGNHPHAVQETEAYRGKLIAYSLGNFIFDQQASPLVRTGVAINLNFTFENDPNLQKWTEFAETCQKFKDDCLARAKAQNLRKPKFKIDYQILATDNSNKLAKKADDQITQAVLTRTNWTTTVKNLNQDWQN
jgi:poly-gamma-glutamate synthesis protein (capsule biosynthesis protein)